MQIDSILIFETQYAMNLYPFSIMHCSWETRIGAFRYFESIQHKHPDSRLIFAGRELQLNSFLKRFNIIDNEIKKENIFILNATVLPDSNFWKEIELKYAEFANKKNISKSLLFEHRGVPVAVYLSKDDILNPIDYDRKFLPKLLSEFNNLLPKTEISEPKLLNFLWDALDNVGTSITEDFPYFPNKVDFNELKNSGINFINKSLISIGENVQISPGVVLDATLGPIIIDKNAKIMANAVIVGPCFIGKNSTVKIGAKIYENTTIGEWCKVGGEIENSIIHAFSNKQHEGFLGHSYISEWVNLGADTNTSDLKNTYSNIKIRFPFKTLDTKRMFLGLLCGDHTKSAINTQFNTGTVTGIAGVLFDSGFLSTTIPSFAWGGAKKESTYNLDKALETARIVMSRRNQVLTDEEIAIFSDEYKQLKSGDTV